MPHSVTHNPLMISPFEPAMLGSRHVRNRLMLAPMTTYSSLASGDIDPSELRYLQRRAEGGLGTVITAACAVHPTGWAFAGQFQCSDDRYLPSLASVAEAIHAGGALAILQIHHGGRQCPPELCGGECLSASAVPATREGAPVPRAMTEVEILEVSGSFGLATKRAANAGFDGVEIHGANTYLLQQFVSPHSNRREDRWGQDRLLFAKEVVRSTLENAPEGLIVGYRFSPEEPEEPGIRMEDTEALLDVLCGSRIDYLHVSLRDFRQGSIHGAFAGPTLNHIAEYVAGRKPIVVAGSVKNSPDANEALKTGASFIALGRIAISDPEWPQHADAARTKIPQGDFATALTLPAGLARRIEAAAGWFERE